MSRPLQFMQLLTCEVVTMPATLENGVIYVSREYGLAIHLCACGCGGKTVTPFEGIDPWQLTDGPNGITLRPSIGNQHWPCGSHYWVTDGEVTQA